MKKKRCTKCGELKPLRESFGKRTRSRSGFQSSCKACDAAFYAAFRAANPARVRAYSARWRAKLNPDRTRAYQANYAAINADRITANRAAWRAANADRIAARVAAWHVANPDKVRAHHGTRRALKVGARVGDRKAYVAFVKWARTTLSIPCRWCRKSTKPGARHIDHIVPLSKGGADSTENLCVSCPHCNLSKRDTLPEVFMSERA